MPMKKGKVLAFVDKSTSNLLDKEYRLYDDGTIEYLYDQSQWKLNQTRDETKTASEALKRELLEAAAPEDKAEAERLLFGTAEKS